MANELELFSTKSSAFSAAFSHLLLDLILPAVNVSVVLLEPPDPSQTSQRPAQLVPMQHAEVREPHGEVPPAPRGVPQIEVSFDVDADGILNVSAKESGSGKSQSITIKNEKGRLSQEEIDRMVNDAKKFEEEDVGIQYT